VKIERLNQLRQNEQAIQTLEPSLWKIQKSVKIPQNNSISPCNKNKEIFK